MNNKAYYNLVNKFFDIIDVFDYVRIDSIKYEYYWDDVKETHDYDIYIEGQVGWNYFDDNGREVVDAWKDFYIIVYDKKLTKKRFLKELNRAFINGKYLDIDDEDVDCKILFVYTNEGGNK